MAASAWTKYDTLGEYIGDGTIDLDDNTFKMALFLSTSNAATVSTSVLASLTNQHANANGYTTGGVTLAATWVRATGTVTWDLADGVWTASGGSIVARFAVIYRSGTVNAVADALMCYSLLDTTPGDITVTTGNTLTIAINASGVFTLAGM